MSPTIDENGNVAANGTELKKKTLWDSMKTVKQDLKSRRDKQDDEIRKILGY